MAAPASNDEFLDLLRKSGVVDEKRLDTHLQKLRAGGTMPSEPSRLAGLLVRDGLLTHFQAEQIMLGKWRRFSIGKYKVLERLGSGGMGSVYLCEHKLMRRRVAVKVLPTAKAADPSSLERFYREARAVAALDHPNIVHAYDIDQDENLHFLVMEYVDGSSLQDIIKKTGPMDVMRACHYIHQALQGLEHAHAAGLVHRDIKPGNILVDRGGVVKVLDMGLARFFNDEDDILTKKYDENVLGTADYLAPEQALDSHGVDIRADIYSLGATFYYMLTGRTPFGEGTVAQKLLWHQTRQPKALSQVRGDAPAALSTVIEKMMAKDPAQRYQLPSAVAEALAPWVQGVIAPPQEAEMPRLSPAATGVSPGEATQISAPASAGTSTAQQKTWQVPSGGKAPARTPPPQPTAPVFASAGTASVTTRPTAPPSTANAANASAPAAAEPQLAPEEAPWESLASDTEDLTAHVDTAPSGSVPKVVRASQARAREQDRRRLKRIAIVVSAILLIPLAFGLWKFFTQATPGPQVRPHLLVGKSQSGAFRTVDQALRNAQAGDVIELLDDVEENLIVDRSRETTAVTIQPAPGKQVVWRPGKKDENRPLLFLSNARGFILRGPGLTLDGSMDGKRRAQNLVFVTLYCPGLTLEDLSLKSFGKSAVAMVNCSGEENRPVRLLNLQFISTSAEKPEAAVYFDANPTVNPPFNEYIEIGPGRFEGMDPKNAVKRKDNTVTGSKVKWPEAK
jgi:serine/threonine protein kinase